MTFKNLKKPIIIFIVVCICAIVGVMIAHIQFPASFLYTIGIKANIYDILNISPNINVDVIEKEYDKIKSSNYKNKKKYLKRTLNVALDMAAEKKWDNEYHLAVIYFEFINNKFKEDGYMFPKEINRSITMDLWECYLYLERFDDFIEDYEIKENEMEDKHWRLINTGLALFLTVDDACSLPKEKKSQYVTWLKDKMDNKLKNIDENSTTYTAFSYAIENYIEPFLSDN